MEFRRETASTECTIGSLADGTQMPRGQLLLICIALVMASLLVYYQVIDHQFLNYDDDIYVRNNPHLAEGITSDGIAWAFTSVDYANWHPVTWLSHMIDVQLYSLNPGGHHITSVAIHAVSGLLLFLLLLQLTGARWRSMFVAALFSLHPLHVESVAWVAERKDVLSGFFAYLTLLCYARYVLNRNRRFYLLALLSFMMGLMSKPMLVTLPLIMLLLDFWPLDRLEQENQRQTVAKHWGLIKEKAPFFACSILSGVVTIYAQRAAGAMVTLREASFQLRVQNAALAYVKYILKTIWPQDLALLYPLPLTIPVWQFCASLLFLIGVSAAVLMSRRKGYLVVGWFWFLVMLLPVIGLIQVGSQAMADRYSYLPSVGLFILVGWGFPELVARCKHRIAVMASLFAAAIVISACITTRQVGYWRDNITLYLHSLQVTGLNPEINYNLGLALQEKGQTDAALLEFQKTVLAAPFFKNAHYNIGVILTQTGRYEEAIAEYRQELALAPNNRNARNNLAGALKVTGRLEAAVREYREALRQAPNDAELHYNLGVTLLTKGERDAALHEYSEAMLISPTSEDVQRLGFTLSNLKGH